MTSPFTGLNGMTTTRRTFVGGVAGAAVLVGLSGCTNSPTKKNTPPSSANAGAPISGGDLRYYLLHAPPSFDPISSVTDLTLCISGQVFSQLVRVAPEQKDLTKIIGDLAESWDISSDGLQYTFHLRQGVSWHDGTPFTADDVTYSLDYMTNAKKSGLAADFPAYKSSRAVDQNTVTVTLSVPQPSFMSMLAQGFSVIEPKHLAGTDPTSTKFLVGTGPFKFESWNQQTFVVSKNPKYFIKGRPYLDSLTMTVIDVPQAQLNAFASHQLDMTYPWDGLQDYTTERTLRGMVPSDVVMSHSILGNLIYFGGRLTPGSPWNDVRVRQAFNLVLNRQSLITVATGNPTWSAPGGFQQPGTAWRESTSELNAAHFGLAAPTADDISKAKALMAAAGYPNGFSLTCLQRSLGEYTSIVSVMGSTLKQHLGVTVVSDVEPSATAITKEDSRLFDFVCDSYDIPTGDPDQALSVYVTGSPANIWNYSNPSFDAAFKKQSQANDPSTRTSAVKQADQILADDLPVLPLLWADMGAAWWPNVHGYFFAPSETTNIPLDNVWLSPS